jgi:hypothetical protein
MIYKDLTGFGNLSGLADWRVAPVQKAPIEAEPVTVTGR